MKPSTTLSRYLAKRYVINLLALLAGLMSIIYLFDTIELIRRASKFDNVPLSLVLQMGLLKLPEVSQMLLPFAVLFSAMYTFWQLTRRSELIVVRAAGFSVWQFLTPIVGLAVLAGILQMTVINPVGAVLLGKFEQLEAHYLSREENQIAVFREGLWLRQGYNDGGQGGYIILHAGKLQQQDWSLKNVMVLSFNAQDQFLERMDAAAARLEPGRWVLENVSVSGRTPTPETQEQVFLPTGLTVQDVEDSFSSPQTMSFWRLPGYIQTLESTGFNASRLRVHYQNLWAQPLMFAAMVLLAASFSMRPPRFRGALLLFSIGIFIGFVIFFLSSFLQALGASQQIPVVLAAWAPAFITFLLGLSALMTLEDG